MRAAAAAAAAAPRRRTPPSAAASAASKSGSSTAFAITPANGTGSPSMSAIASSVSVTGSSSGVVTRTTPVRSGSSTNSATQVARVCTGPTRATWVKVRGTFRNPRPWPVAGASTTARSWRPDSSSWRILASVTSSRSPGAAAVRCPKAPFDTIRSTTARTLSWLTRYSSSAFWGSIEKASSPG